MFSGDWGKNWIPGEECLKYTSRNRSNIRSRVEIFTLLKFQFVSYRLTVNCNFRTRQLKLYILQSARTYFSFIKFILNFHMRGVLLFFGRSTRNCAHVASGFGPARTKSARIRDALFGDFGVCLRPTPLFGLRRRDGAHTPSHKHTNGGLMFEIDLAPWRAACGCCVQMATRIASRRTNWKGIFCLCVLCFASRHLFYILDLCLQFDITNRLFIVTLLARKTGQLKNR